MAASRESERIATLARIFGKRGDRELHGIGDDAAVVKPGGAVIVTSVDAVVDGVHFTREHFPPEAIGRKAAASALSDLAAMGATPGEVYIAAGIPDDFGDDEFERLALGIEEVVAAAGATASGGDLTAARDLWLSVTVVGYANSESEIVSRYGARPGDLVAVTGTLGGSAAALASLTSNAGDADHQKQLHPVPRFAAGKALAANGATSMIDVSDGLARDAKQIADAADVAIEIDLQKLPHAAGVSSATAAAESGEEYELLCTLAPADFAAAVAAVAATGTTLTEIGRVLPGSGASFLGSDGRPVAVAGYQHFD